MFKLSDCDAKDIFIMEYHFEDETLDLEIREPQSIEILDNGQHTIEDSDGFIFIIRPEWVYLSILKRKIAKETNRYE
jgi:hypothetical protein